MRLVRFVPLIPIVLMVTACGGAGGLRPTPTGTTTSGATFTLVGGIEADGPGVSVSQAIARVGEEPQLVVGILMKDAEGTVWLCEALVSSSPPECEPRLRVENFPADSADFESGTGLHVDGGVSWVEDERLYGVVQP